MIKCAKCRPWAFREGFGPLLDIPFGVQVWFSACSFVLRMGLVEFTYIGLIGLQGSAAIVRGYGSL